MKNLCRSVLFASVMLVGAALEAGSLEVNTVQLGGWFGLEYRVMGPMTLSAQAGVVYSRRDFDGETDSGFIAGDSSLQINFYW